ncbi:pirin family protein [Ruegeria lacuscaerulensis]|uniref:pirin family protein n=1 Tax=Ruegeria lacuscaerulensis TaxID=55218 RepID=UPI00147C33CF
MVDGEVLHIDPNVSEHTGTLAAKGIQVITAGTGIVHNEINNSDNDPMRALQIWFRPRANNLAPAYLKKTLNSASHTDLFELVLAPDGADGALVAQQDASMMLRFLHTCAKHHLSTPNNRQRRLCFCDQRFSKCR